MMRQMRQDTSHMVDMEVNIYPFLNFVLNACYLCTDVLRSPIVKKLSLWSSVLGGLERMGS
jgi:hypothetical protein